MNTNDLAQKIEKLEAIEEIKSLKHRYFRAMTFGDYAMLRDTLTEDVRTSYSDGEYVFEDREKLLAFLIESHSAEAKVVAYWMCGMPELTIESSSEATGIWAFYHRYYQHAQQYVDEMYSYYDDRYRKESGVWRICETGYKRVLNQELYTSGTAYKLKVPAWPMPGAE